MDMQLSNCSTNKAVPSGVLGLRNSHCVGRLRANRGLDTPELTERRIRYQPDPPEVQEYPDAKHHRTASTGSRESESQARRNRNERCRPTIDGNIPLDPANRDGADKRLAVTNHKG